MNWKRNDHNQREDYEVQNIPHNASGTRRRKLIREPAPPQSKLLYPRGDISHTPKDTLRVAARVTPAGMYFLLLQRLRWS